MQKVEKKLRKTPMYGSLKQGKNTTLYVSGLKYSLDAIDVKKLIQKYAKVNFVNIVKDKNTGLNKGIAFVQVSDLEGAKRVIKELDKKVLMGRTLGVSIAKQNKPFIQTQRSEKSPAETDLGSVKPPRRRRDKKAGLNVLFDHLKNNK